MPLDVQPISKSRQAVMILVMLALLGLSLGFAQLLIGRRAAPAVLRPSFPPPEGVKSLPVNTSTQAALLGVLVQAQAQWPQGPRRFQAFFFADDAEEDGVPLTPPQYMEGLLDRVLPDPSEQALTVRGALLAGLPALEAQRQVGRGNDSAFAIIRLAPVDAGGGSILAFCFSGDGRMTDADKQFFNDYCTHRIQMSVDRSTRRGRP